MIFFVYHGGMYIKLIMNHDMMRGKLRERYECQIFFNIFSSRQNALVSKKCPGNRNKLQNSH